MYFGRCEVNATLPALSLDSTLSGTDYFILTKENSVGVCAA